MHPLLKLGTAKIDITPKFPVPLAGFSSRKELGPCEGVSHPLFARIFLFQQEDEARNGQKALLISADLIWWGTDRVRGLKEQIARRWGIEEDAIIFHGTHTHSGPQTSSLFTPLLGEFDADYIRDMESKMVEGIERAGSRLEPVAIERGIGCCDIGVNRRLSAQMSPNLEGPTDPDVNVIRFVTEHGEPRALLVHYTCHPVVTRENLVSCEFTGVAMEQLEEAMGEGAIAAFLQGCCGDINPGMEGRFCFGDDSEVRQLGSKFAEAVLGILARPMAAVPPSPLGFVRKAVSLPLQKLPTLQELEDKKENDGVEGEWSRLLLEAPHKFVPHVAFELTLLTIGHGLSFLAMNSEVVVEYGLLLKEHVGSRILPIPYSNGMIGYVPTAKQLEEGGYEALESTLYFGLPAPFDPEIETIISTEMTNWTVAGLEAENN
ncbi:neutral/alkaline non-lysosomal ceramidase N-terminal domain-containing protein [Paenibacillus sp. MBLB4367]|uniref:neutral/alkaline non-lysosomal ceramidase N-terminal domain-containing protein n=1 Tax=Paenibacillus sp. MBLB4367 TaxID=3384767 RepID=UPI00390801CF